MTNLSIWHKNLSVVSSFVLAVSFLIIFLVYEYFLFSRLLAENYLERGISSLEQAKRTPDALLVDKTVVYQNGFRFLNFSLKLNSLDSRPNLEIALALRGIAENDQLRKSIDISELGLIGKEKSLFYGLIRDNYISAIVKEPTNMLYHQGLGNVYEVLGDFTAAEDQLGKAIALDPQNASMNLYLCKYFYAKDSKQEFERYLKKVVELQKKELYGGGPNTSTNAGVLEFLHSINRQELIE